MKMPEDQTLMTTSITAIVAFGIVLAFLSLAYLFFGIVTGVFGMCSTASEWWIKIYWWLFILVPFSALITGFTVGKYVYEKSLGQMKLR